MAGQASQWPSRVVGVSATPESRQRFRGFFRSAILHIIYLPAQALSREIDTQEQNIFLDFLPAQAYIAGMGKKKNPHAVALGRRGAKKGGLARAASLSPEQRKEIARKAAAARWQQQKQG